MSINKTKVKEFLERFISGDMEVVGTPNTGLCWNLKMFCTYSVKPAPHYYTFISIGCIGWNGIVERECFPIPLHPVDRLYEGSQLEQRISLAKHLLTKVDDYED